MLVVRDPIVLVPIDVISTVDQHEYGEIRNEKLTVCCVSCITCLLYPTVRLFIYVGESAGVTLEEGQHGCFSFFCSSTAPSLSGASSCIAIIARRSLSFVDRGVEL